eukprot:Gb_29657 [translate_table: standard]
MFACLVDEMNNTEENTEQCSRPHDPDMKNMKINLKIGLKPNVAQLVEEDNADGLEEVLQAERALETMPLSKKGKKNKRNVLKETDEFSKLTRRVLHYACALDSVKCCKLLVECEKFPSVCVDAVDEVNQHSGLHIASYYHSQKCMDFLLKKGANHSLLNKHSMMPIEEALLSPSLNVEWDFSTNAAEIVKRVGEKDLKILKTLGIKCNCKDVLAALAFKLAKGMALVPLVALLHVRRSIVNVVIKGSEFDIESGRTIVDYLLGKVLGFLPPNMSDEISWKLAKCKTINSEELGLLEDVNSNKNLGARDDNPEIKYRKDITEWEQINSKYCTNINETHAVRKTGSLARESNKAYSRQMGTMNDDVQTNSRLARKMLECVLQFVQSWSAHSQNSLPPLIRAVQVNDEALLNALLASAAPVNDTDHDGNTALHWALKQATSVNGRSLNCKIVERLLDAGANVTSGNNSGATPVHTAAGHGHLEALSLIIKKHSGSINILAGTRETPLHYAVKNNHLACAAVLLRHGANKDVISLRNHKPFQLARSSEMIALLSLEEKELLEEACDNIIASQQINPSTVGQSFSGSKYSYSQESCGTDCFSSLGSSPSSAQLFSFSQCVPPAVLPSNMAQPMALSFSQTLAKAPQQCQAQSSSQIPGSSPQQADQAINSASWQTVHKKSRKQTNSLGSVSNAKEMPTAKTGVTLPPYKSVLCRFSANNCKCEWGSNCHFAHSEEELLKGQQLMRHLGQKGEVVQSSSASSDTSDGARNYKIKLCMHYEKNRTCRNGSKCKFAHGQRELRPTSASSSVASGARFGPRPSTASSFGSYSSEEVEEMNSRKVFVGGLPSYVNGRELQEFMEGEFGKVIDSTVICGNDEDGIIRSRGFGFVLFEHQKDADEAVRRHYIPFLGKKVELKKAMTRIELASGDEDGKQTSYTSLSASALSQSLAVPSSSSAIGMFDDGSHSPGSATAGYHQGLSQRSSSVDLSPSMSQNNPEYLQPAGLTSGGDLPAHSESIYTKNCTLESYLSSDKQSPYISTQNSEQFLNVDDTLSSSSFLSYNACDLPSLGSLSSVCTAPFSNGNKCIRPSSSQPFTYYSSGPSNSYFSTVPEANGPNQIDGNDDDDDENLSQLLALLGVGPLSEPNQAKSFPYITSNSNHSVNQAVLPVSVPNGWVEDSLASCQNMDSLFMYNRSQHGSTPKETDYDSQLSGDLSFFHSPERSRAVSDTLNDFCYNGLLPEYFAYDGAFSAGSQGLSRVHCPIQNDSSLQRFSTSQLSKSISKTSNGYLQEYNDVGQFKRYGN